MSEVTEADLMIRSVEHGDLKKLMEHRNDWGTRRFLEDCREVTEEDQERWFKGASERYRIIELEGLRIGLMRFHAYAGGDAEIGVDIFREHRRHGYGTAAMQRAILMARELGCKSCSLWVFMENDPALAIYAKLKFMIDMNTPMKFFFRGPTPMHYVRMVLAL